MYQVLARKWRPRNFDELVGQEHVARTLSNSIRLNRLAHAYVFAGLRGTGKTTVARIFAKCLNCETGPTATPCDTCTPCREITEGRALDVLEIDAASRTGVSDIRELQEVVSYAPARDRYRVLIIDEAHMLSKQAFNALLKTLEEPPPKVIFVLATTELQKILPTILSRCQLFEFRRVTPREVATHLLKVCEAEGAHVTGTVLDRIARAGEGSVRDSLSLLERVLAFGGDSVSEDEALGVLGAVRTEVLARLLQGLARRDAAGMLSVLEEIVGEGHDLLHFWGELIGALRDQLLLRTIPDRADLLSRSPAESAALARAGEDLSREDLTRAFQILSELEFGLKSSSQPLFLFEAALIRLADLAAVRPIEEVLASLGGAEPRSTMPSPQKKTHPESASAPVAPAAGGAGPVPTPGALRSSLHDTKPMLDAMLDHASGIAFEGRVLRIAFPANLEAIRRQLERPENLAALGEAAARTAGGRVEVRIVTDAAPSAQATVVPALPVLGISQEAGRDGLLESATREPGVARLLHEFGAQIVDIRELGAAPRPGLEIQAEESS